MTRSTFLSLVGFLACCLVAALASWDPRLDDIGVTTTQAQDCSGGCWQLITARYEDPNESGGNHNIYARLHDERGTVMVDVPWHVAWTNGDVRILTKPLPEWGDFPIFACYNHEIGPGPYYAYAGDDPTASDVVWGMGLPQCSHVNFRLEWQWLPPMDLEPRLWLPVMRQGQGGR